MTTNPARYRHRTPEVEAVQWLDTNADALAAFAGQRFMTVDPEDRIDDPDATGSLRESEHECWSLLRPGDWVVKRGEDFAVLTAERFAERYEPAPVSSAVDHTLRDRVVAAIKSSRFEELRTVDHSPNGPLQITIRVDDLADAVLSVLPPPADRATVLREAADAVAADTDHIRHGSATDYAERHAALLRRMADEAEPEPEALRAELKPWQLLGDQPDEPLPQTERLRDGRRLQSAAGARQPDTETHTSPSNRRALVHNAITGALSAAGDWVPLSVRIAATRAALAEVDAWHADDPAVRGVSAADDSGEETDRD